jgi:NAD dependent epimerase/dehydratase family enzyme
MNILITGGTGLIGRALSAALAADGHQVSVLTRNPDKARNVLVSGVLPLKWQNTDIKALSRLIEQNDAVINLAGESIAGENLLGILTKRWTDESKKTHPGQPRGYGRNSR